MKHFAKLVIFFSVSFISILLVSGLITLFEEMINLAILFPPGQGTHLNLLTFLGNSVPVAFFISILLGSSYALRRHFSYPVVFAIILTLSLVFSSAVYVGVEKSGSLGASSTKEPPATALLAQPGYIYNPGSRDTRFVFLQDPYKLSGPRVVAAADLYYQRLGTSLESSPLPFAKEKSGILESIAKDFTQCSVSFTALFKAGSGDYLVYAGSLATFLLALGCLINISYWHLANLFFAICVFRGALALEILLNEPNVSGMVRSFVGGGIPATLINPVIYILLAALILLYSGLTSLARGRRHV